MLNGNGELPAFPMRVACEALVGPPPSGANGGDLELLSGGQRVLRRGLVVGGTQPG
jgi:hypothetical protein